MWLSERTAARYEEETGCMLGNVSQGGTKPKAVIFGQAQEARLFSRGAVYVPNAEDEVLTAVTSEGQCFILGATGAALPQGTEKGELILLNGSGGMIKIKPDGTVELSGRIKLAGKTEITGPLTINGEEYVSPTISGKQSAQGGGEAGA